MTHPPLSMIETLHFESGRALQQLLGGDDRVTRQLETDLGVKATVRDGMVRLEGSDEAVGRARRLFDVLAGVHLPVLVQGADLLHAPEGERQHLLRRLRRGYVE